MIHLPLEFTSRMKDMLGNQYQDFINSYENPRCFGLRVNTLKISPEEFLERSPFSLRKIPWIPNGFFYSSQDHPARHPYYQAGLYYLQEPSAMTPAACLPVEPGDRVLDLCAAPGGKATELGARLKGQGILVANDISLSRARALLRNLELFGIPNSFVTSEVPAHMASRFPEYFQKILLDAPCSGEGMFRKDPSVIDTWSPARTQELSAIQKDLAARAVSMLCAGGYLLYSTCTFAPCENEEVISYILETFPEMKLVDLPAYEGFSPGNPLWGNGSQELRKCVRIWPHKMDGEGHFMALLKKDGLSSQEVTATQGKADAASRKLMEEFFSSVSLKSLGMTDAIAWNRIEVRSGKAFLLPPVSLPRGKANFLRNGLYLGDIKKNRFEPSQPFALALLGQSVTRFSLSSSDERISRYLKGETIPLSPEECPVSKGWGLLCAEDFPLGWGKLVNQTLKNKYPAGWRLS